MPTGYEVTYWKIKPGATVVRKALHEEYGGRPQGGIGPSRKSPNVFLFTDPSTGLQHGYVDGWKADGCFHYTGEGQRGDQRMMSGNAAVLNYDDPGDARALRVFEGSGGTITYMDEFELDAKIPYYETDAPETGGGQVRKVIVFRLRPKTITPVAVKTPLANVTDSKVEIVPVEEQYTERAFVDPSREPYVAERVEAKLVLALRDHLLMKNHDVGRLKIVPRGEVKPLFTDLFDETANVMVEAKGTVTREAFRMAIGQLADYSRFRPDAGKMILVPEEPRADLLELAASQKVDVVWPTGDALPYGGSAKVPW